MRRESPVLRRRVREALLLALLAFGLASCGGTTPAATTDGDSEDLESLPSDGDTESEAEREGWEIPAELEGIDPSLCAYAGPDDRYGFEASYDPLAAGDVLGDKAFFLLEAFSREEGLRAAWSADPTLSALSAKADAAFRDAACTADRACWATRLAWTDEESARIGEALAALPVASELASRHLRPSGRFQRFAEQADGALVKTAWQETAKALRVAWDAFSGGVEAARLDALIAEVKRSHPAGFLFYEPWQETVLALMHELKRDEAGRYEPLTAGENRAALARLAGIDWTAYPFSVILVPGQGPTSLEQALNPTGAARCDLAVARFKAGLAPFILTSGGHVHPDRTPYCEALEMKKYLMSRHGIPENAILVDPHARHTTTNVRNASRLILRYGLPLTQAALVTSDEFQSIGIHSMDGRCREEMGYLPYRMVVRLTRNDSCFLAAPAALSADPADPLDP